MLPTLDDILFQRSEPRINREDKRGAKLMRRAPDCILVPGCGERTVSSGRNSRGASSPPGPRCTAKVTTQCCCDEATSTAAASSSVCWSGEYTAARCCDRARGPTGDTACWSGSYDYGACCKTPAQKPSAEGKIHRADPYLGPTLTSSNRNYQSNCWVNLKMMGQPCRFQASARRAGAGSRIRRQTAPLRRGPVAALTGACNPMGRRAAANSCARFASRWPPRPRPRRRPMRRSRRS